ncbi:hypothetical protein SprV_0100436600 [Sparganum proliferum]
MLYGGPLGTYLSGYYAPGAGSTVTTPASASTSSAYPSSSSGTSGAGGLTRSRSSRFRTPSAYTVSSAGAGAASASTTNNRSSFYTPQTRRKYGEESVFQVERSRAPMIRPLRGNDETSHGSSSSRSSSIDSSGDGKINGDRYRAGCNDNRTLILGHSRGAVERSSGKDYSAETEKGKNVNGGGSESSSSSSIGGNNDRMSGKNPLNGSGNKDGGINSQRRSSNRAYGSDIDISSDEDCVFQVKTSNDNKKRYTSTGSGPTSTTRYNRPSYTATISSTPLVSSSMSPALESSAGPDYKALYEAEKIETTQLRSSITVKQKQLDEIRLQIEETRKAYYPGDPDRRKVERHISECEEEMKVLEALRAESEKLKAEHRALTRVVSHLM